MVRSIVDWKLLWVISVGTVEGRRVAMFRSGIGLILPQAGDRHVEQRLDRVDVLLEILHARRNTGSW